MNAPEKPGPWIDLGLTLPIFLVYHLGVVFLNVHNASDLVTYQLLRAAQGNKETYLLLCAAIGVVFVGVFAWLGRGHAFRPSKFIQIALEGIAYAFLLRLGGAYVVGKLFAASVVAHGAPAVASGVAVAGAGTGATVAAAAPVGPVAGMLSQSTFGGVVMSLGAGFYEELTFRVLLFGLGAKLVTWLLVGGRAAPRQTGGARPLSMRALFVGALWALAAAAVFSGVHYLGTLGDSFRATSFVFRLVLGLLLTLIFVTRGFAAAVWAHALYDIWVLVL